MGLMNNLQAERQADLQNILMVNFFSYSIDDVYES